MTRRFEIPAANAPLSAGAAHWSTTGLEVHTLFDRGYVTVTPELKVEVSSRIREEFENGRDYYKLHGQSLREPVRSQWRPSPDFLDWHSSQLCTSVMGTVASAGVFAR